MSYLIATATSHTDLLTQFKDFLSQKGSAFGLTYTGTGNGTFTAYRGGASSVAETFTITATSSTSFDVVGSVTGSIGPATAGTPFAHAKIEFTITAGGTAFVAGDKFRINTAPPWTVMRYTAGSEVILKAPGNDGAQSIYVGAQIFSDAGADYYNWRLGGFNGYNSGFTFANQPGAMTRPVVPLRNSSIPFWLVNNGRSVRMVAKVSTVYEPLYLGYIDTYFTPGEYPYPIAVGGGLSFLSEPASTSTNWRWSYTGGEHRAFPMGYQTTTAGDNCALRLRDTSGVWRGFGSMDSVGSATNSGGNHNWPYSDGMVTLRPNIDGSYPQFPVILHSNDTNTWGALDGIEAVTGQGLSAETSLTVGPDSYIAFPNIFRAGTRDFYALKLD